MGLERRPGDGLPDDLISVESEETAPIVMPEHISILMYHQVGDFAPMKQHRANYCDHRRFARQMAFLHRAGFHVLDLDTALACLRGHRPTPPRSVVLTFDDAYDSFADYALPILKRYDFPATVYAISGWIGRRAEWFAKDPGRAIPGLMDANRLRTIRAAGITIGSHTALSSEIDPILPDLARSIEDVDTG
jgi:peptidoglycan/xylan/chitin deacetylase (PgdA/CDA1 family)